MSARASKHPTHRVDRSNDSTRALAGKDPSTGAKEDTASARFRLDRGIKSTVDDGTREFRRRYRRRSPRRVRRPGVASDIFRGDSSRRSTRSGKVVSRLARVAGLGKRTCEPQRSASSVRERRSTIPVSVHARFCACAARLELLQRRRCHANFSRPVFSASVTTRLRGFVGQAAKLSRPLSPGKAREFWRQSVTPDFARVLISKRRVTYEKSRFPVKSTAGPLAKRRLAHQMTWQRPGKRQASREKTPESIDSATRQKAGLFRFDLVGRPLAEPQVRFPPSKYRVRRPRGRGRRRDGRGRQKLARARRRATSAQTTFSSPHAPGESVPRFPPPALPPALGVRHPRRTTWRHDTARPGT